MAQPRIIINEALEAAVKNLEEINLGIQYNEYNPSIDDISPEFVRTGGDTDGVQYIEDFINVYGFNTKIPSRIEFDDFNIGGYLDVGNSSNTITEPPQEEVWKIQFISNSDNFREIAANTRLDRFIDESDYVTYRYVRNGVPDYLEVVLLSISLYLVVKEVIQQVRDLAEAINELIVLLTPEPENPLAPLPSFTRAIVARILGIIVQAAYLIATLIAINELLRAISDALFSKPRKVFGLDVYNTIEAGCSYLGYEFQSDILKEEFNNLTYARAFGYDKDGDPLGEITATPKNNPIPPVGLLGFIENIAQLFNGKLRVTNDNVVQLENRQYFEEEPLDITLNDIYQKGDYVFESNESLKYIYVGYAQNGSEKNSNRDEAAITYNLSADGLSQQELSELAGQDLQTSLDGLLTASQGNNSSLIINLPYLKANRKTGQKFVERLFNSIFDVFAGLNKNYTVKVGDRRDFIMFENDSLPTDTIFIRNGEKVSTTNDDVLSSEAIIQYYKTEGMDQSQWRRYTARGQEPLLEQEGYSGLLNNNVIFDEFGNKINLTSNLFDSRSGLFELQYRRRLNPTDAGYIPASAIDIKEIYNG